MKKLILILFACFLTANIAFCEELPKPGQGGIITKEKNPVYYSYIETYALQLKNAFYKSGYRRNHMGTSYDYVIKRDGTICNLKRDLYDSKKLTEIVKQIIINNPPPPFYDGMDIDEFNITVFMGTENYEEFKFKYYPRDNLFWINIIKKQ